jgi:hypothetical protein
VGVGIARDGIGIVMSGMVFSQERYEVRNDKGNVYVYEYRNVRGDNEDERRGQVNGIDERRAN